MTDTPPPPEMPPKASPEMPLRPIAPDVSAGPELAPIQMPRRSYFWAIIGFVLLVLGPIGVSAFYYSQIAADRYVAEFRYAVRAGQMVSDSEGVGGSTGASAALMIAGDSFVLENYIRSARAMLDIETLLPLREMLDGDGDDPVRMYSPDLPPEDLIAFWQAAVDVHFDVITGISVVRVKLYRPEDSKAVADALVERLRIVVDQLSEEAQSETIAYVEGEVNDAQFELEQRNKSIEEFRTSNRTFSPEVSTTQTEGVIEQLLQARADLTVQLGTLPIDSPRRGALVEQLRSINSEIAIQRRRVGGEEESDLPELLNEFERMRTEQGIALTSYTSAIELAREARAFATLGQVQLVVFVPPALPVIATEPVRWLEVLIIGLIVFSVWLVGRIFIASLRTP